MVLVSSNHNFHQLVTDRVRVYEDVKNTRWDVAAVREPYQLAQPREVSVYQQDRAGLSAAASALTRGPARAATARQATGTAARDGAVLRPPIRPGRHPEALSHSRDQL